MAAGRLPECELARQSEALEQAVSRAEALDSGSLPPLGLHILMGPEFPAISRNMLRNLQEQRLTLLNAVLAADE